MKRSIAFFLLPLAAAACLRANTYEIEEITLPSAMVPEVSGVTFTPDGQLVVINRHGEVWLTADPKNGPWRRFAFGLHEPLGVFAASIGLPFMAVSANAPLLQAWFARSGHPDAHDPYFMYAASNLGSLIALLSYPFVLEPAFGLSQLSHLWAWGYGLLVLAIAVSFFLMRGAQAGGVPEAAADAAPAGADATSAGPPTLGSRLAWIGLAFVPAALLTAFTAHITTDVASAPLLWVLPLAL